MLLHFFIIVYWLLNQIQEGDSILLLYGKSDIICEALGKIRTKVANVMQVA